MSRQRLVVSSSDNEDEGTKEVKEEQDQRRTCTTSI